MNIQLPYENSDLNVQYLLAKNTEVNTTSSMITVCFLAMLFIMYNTSKSVINNYKSQNIQLQYILNLLNKVYKLDLDLSDLGKLINTLEEKTDESENESENESDCGSDGDGGSTNAWNLYMMDRGGSDEENTHNSNETINLMVTLDDNSRRVLRSHTKNSSDSNLVIKGKGWKLD